MKILNPSNLSNSAEPVAPYNTRRMPSLYSDLCRFAAADWIRAVDTLSAGIHEIDRDATRIWFAFFPLDLHLALEAARTEGGDEAERELAQKLGLMGQWRLADQIDRSHRFLFAHRYWPQVKSAIERDDRVAGGAAGDHHRGRDGGDAHGARRSRLAARHERGRPDDAASGRAGRRLPPRRARSICRIACARGRRIRC